MRKCRIGTAKFFTLLLLLYHTSIKPAALTEWSREEVADPWLIATAAVGNYTIVSFENENKGLNTRNPSKNAKIPDVAKVFKVEVKNLYYMMRVLKFSL